MPPSFIDRRRTLFLLASLATGGRAAARDGDTEQLRLELERTYVSWLQAIRRSDVGRLTRGESQHDRIASHLN